MRNNILISKAVRFWAAFDFSFGKAGFTLKSLTSRQSRVTRLAGARPFCLLRRHFPALRGITLASRGGFGARDEPFQSRAVRHTETLHCYLFTAFANRPITIRARCTGGDFQLLSA